MRKILTEPSVWSLIGHALVVEAPVSTFVCVWKKAHNSVLLNYGGSSMSTQGQGKQNDGPVVFIDASIRTPKAGGNRYIWSKTFDLEAIKRELGTSIVSLRVVTPKKRENVKDDDRLIIVSPSEAKWLPRNTGRGGKGRAKSEDDNDVVL